MNFFPRLIKTYRNTTFHRQLAILAAASVVSVTLLAALTTAWYSSQQIRANQLRLGELIAHNLATQSRLALIFDAPANAEEVAAASLAFPDVIQIEIRHADGRLLLAKGQFWREPMPFATSAMARDAYLESEDELSWRFVAPVFALVSDASSPDAASKPPGNVLGYVRISQSKATLTRLTHEVFLINLITGLLFTVLFLPALRTLVKRLTQPLNALSATMASAEAGETGLRVNPASSRDLAHMARAFNCMMAAQEQREQELRLAHDNALRFARQKADFAAAISHEIRSPLKGLACTLEMMKAGPLSREQQRLLELASDSSQYLRELIDNILDFSRREAGSVTTESSVFEPDNLVSATLNIYRSQAAAKGLDLTSSVAADVPRQLTGDAPRIRQILVNLVGRAIEFADTGRVAVHTDLDQAGQLRFTISGSGSASSADASGTAAHPTGDDSLSLTVCKQLARMLGGEMGGHGTPGQESRFWFSIPCVTPNPEAIANQPLSRAAESRGHILIVEDNRTNQVIAAGMLRLLGCTYDMAENGARAIEAWQNGRWDLILMDCNMPETDGYEATASIRQQEALKGERIPIVAMTANTQAVDIEKCLAAGMDDHLPKPLTIETLTAKLQRWLRWPADSGYGESTESGSSPSLDATVLQRLREALGGSIGEAIRPFLEDMPGYLVELERAVADRNASALRRVAHIIKGAAGNLGAHAMAGLAKEIEVHAEAGVLAGTGDLVTRLRTEFIQVEPALATQLGHAIQAMDPVEEKDAPLVLVVDDDRSTRSALRHVLRRSGFRVEEAGDGNEALAWLEHGVADVILMDAMMPVMDGFTACATIKMNPAWRDIPVLMITALEDRLSIERAFDAGASDFIPKPIHLSVVNQRVRRIIDATRAERHVRHLAYIDTLTGLPNRAFFLDQLARSIEQSASRNGLMAILFLDLDRFKYVNDTQGHEVGDRLLAAMAQRIRGCVRGDDCVARLGGDEFVILLSDLPTAGVAGSVAQNICRTVSAPLQIEDQEIFVSASIGISLFPGDGADVSSLLRHADTAMYRAKQNGGGFSYYESAMESIIAERVQLENALRRALERDEITVFYQPVVDAASQSIATVEALVRWRHPDRGIVSPMEFIPVAEETGLILPLGERVLRSACFQTKAWLDAGLPLQGVAVNLSARQLSQAELCDVVSQTLQESGLPPDMLILEITESVLMEKAQDPAGILHTLRALGVRISIDDFGTGYSSLSYLKHLPVDYLKIDRSFIKDIQEDTDAEAIVTGVVTLAHNLRLKVVAEGVELASQRDLLSQLGCDYLQGFLYSRPAPAEVIETLLQAASTKALPSS